MLYCGVCIDLLPIVAIPELEAFILSPTTQENFPDYAKLTVACFESVILEVNTKWKCKSGSNCEKFQTVSLVGFSL